MLVLNVAEKNDAAKGIAGLLSRGTSERIEGKSKFNKIYKFHYNINGTPADMLMTSVSGHMLNMAFPPSLKIWESVDPVLLFDSSVDKICTDNMVLVKKSLEDLIKKCKMLIIWTDCDREGENIGMEIVDTCRAVNARITVKRAKFSEITLQSVTRALNNLVDMDVKLSHAVDVRQELDLKSGAAFTRLQTLFLRIHFPQTLSNQIISYGSCQFPTLGFVVERYKEVENFVSEPFWKLIATHLKNNDSVTFRWCRDELYDENIVRIILRCITNGGTVACVTKVTNKPKSKWRPQAMDTIEMEKLSSRKLKINPKTTMQIAEKLYSQGFISYPRTETNIFPKEMNLTSLVEAQISDHRWGDFARRLLPDFINPRNGKKTDNAHPPIHPLKSGAELRDNDARLFELITRHFLACLSQDAVGHETEIFIDCIGAVFGTDNWPVEGDHRKTREAFKLTGLAVLERNYLDVYPYDKWSDKEVPPYVVGEIFHPNIDMNQGATSAPSLLTEADLITLMDKNGIGTDATHAEHIDKVKTREYVGNTGPNNMYLIPGKLGMGLVEAYDLMGFFLSRPEMRSKFEADLELICRGVKQPSDVLHYHLNEYKTIFQQAVTQIAKLQQGVAQYLDEIPTVNSDTPNLRFLHAGALAFQDENVRACPSCDGTVSIKKSRQDKWYLGCSRYPVCNRALWLPDTVDDAKIARITYPAGTIISCGNHHDNARDLPVNKISIRFSVAMGMIIDLVPDEDRRYTVCLYCHFDACELLNIKHKHTPNKSNTPNIRLTSKTTTTTPQWAREFKQAKPEVKTQPLSQSSQFNQPNSVSMSNATSTNNNPVCFCKEVAVLRQVSKDGPNKGRSFYTCRLSQCQMFSWADSESTNQQPTSSHPMPENDHSIVMCKCGHKATLLTVRKESENKGRQFYSCSQSTRCGFFQWSDQPQSSQKAAPKNPRKRNSDSKNDIFQPKKIIGAGDMVWPPAAKEFKTPKAKLKTIRCCTRCRNPGHTAKTCPMNQ